MTLQPLKDDLFRLRDETYVAFQTKLIPNIESKRILGVRMPDLRQLADYYYRNEPAVVEAFLQDLPHFYLEGEHLHLLLLAKEKDPQFVLAELDRFLPTLSNWASCDNRSPKCLKKEPNLTLTYIDSWLDSSSTYTVRYAIKLLKDNYLKDNFDPTYLARVGEIDSGQYYIQMMVAWYFSDALIYQKKAALQFLESGQMEGKTHNQAIQKAVESRRISDDDKAYLKSLKKQVLAHLKVSALGIRLCSNHRPNIQVTRCDMMSLEPFS